MENVDELKKEIANIKMTIQKFLEEGIPLQQPPIEEEK
jgi:hypothetical protein